MILEIAAGLVTLGIGWFTTGVIKKKWNPSMTYAKHPGYQYKYMIRAAWSMAEYDAQQPEGPKKRIENFLEADISPIFFSEENWSDYFELYQNKFLEKSRNRKKYSLDSIPELDNVRAAKGAAIKEVEQMNREVQ